MTEGRRRRIALFGGTFDPVHIGHLCVAESVRQSAALDRILFVPAHIHPVKTRERIAAPEHRLAMLHLAIAGNPALGVSDAEVHRSEVSYTVDTLRHFRATMPADEVDLFFLMGADNLREFDTWREPDAIVALCRILAVGRPGHPAPQVPERFREAVDRVEAPSLDISSTGIREEVAMGRSVRYLVPDPVWRYIAEQGLYRED